MKRRCFAFNSLCFHDESPSRSGVAASSATGDSIASAMWVFPMYVYKHFATTTCGAVAYKTKAVIALSPLTGIRHHANSMADPGSLSDLG